MPSPPIGNLSPGIAHFKVNLSPGIALFDFPPRKTLSLCIECRTTRKEPTSYREGLETYTYIRKYAFTTYLDSMDVTFKTVSTEVKAAEDEKKKTQRKLPSLSKRSQGNVVCSRDCIEVLFDASFAQEYMKVMRGKCTSGGREREYRTMRPMVGMTEFPGRGTPLQTKQSSPTFVFFFSFLKTWLY